MQARVESSCASRSLGGTVQGSRQIICRRLAVVTKALTAQGGGWMWDGRIKIMQGDEVVAWLEEQNMGKKAVDGPVHRMGATSVGGNSETGMLAEHAK
ncbi:Ff.00g065030.m01.CDS01 [Fusarium sp. VM40]|nr:Ff.00g065030.m01.CDS01 [Fusarium sp. VM40]